MSTMNNSDKMNVTSSMDGTDPEQAPKTLKLTGNVILATAMIPYEAAFVKGSHGWVCDTLFFLPPRLLVDCWFLVGFAAFDCVQWGREERRSTRCGLG